MARENVSYARCICDICEKEEHISQSLILPKGWETVKVGESKMELCEECFENMKLYISGWIRKKRIPQNLMKVQEEIQWKD